MQARQDCPPQADPELTEALRVLPVTADFCLGYPQAPDQVWRQPMTGPDFPDESTAHAAIHANTVLKFAFPDLPLKQETRGQPESADHPEVITNMDAFDADATGKQADSEAWKRFLSGRSWIDPR